MQDDGVPTPVAFYNTVLALILAPIVSTATAAKPTTSIRQRKIGGRSDGSCKGRQSHGRLPTCQRRGPKETEMSERRAGSRNQSRGIVNCYRIKAEAQP